MSWAHDDLWAKAKVYMERAIAAGPDDDLYPFWASLSLELLARASLAKIHPALLADPSQGGTSILYACGLRNPAAKLQAPRSIPAHTLFERCKAAVPGFIADDEIFCRALAEKRNSELHTGEPAFATFKTDAWLARFYRICKKLLDQQGKTLADFLGDTALAEAAEEMVLSDDASERAAALRAVGISKATFGALPTADQEARRAAAVPPAYLPAGRIRRNCPACEAVGVVSGTRIRVSDPRLEDDYVVTDITYLPNTFKCESCGLHLAKYAMLDASGLGGQFQSEESQAADDYYGADDNRWEPEYGND